MNERGPELFRIVVPGQPAGAGSKTAQTLGKRGSEKRDGNGRIVLIYRPDSKLTEPWMKKVRAQAEVVWFSGAAKSMVKPLDGALWLDVSFYEERPKAHYRSVKGGPVLRADAPAYPHRTSTHDIDKMRRAISDSLTNAGVIMDDKRIVAGNAWKLYADEPPRQACAVIRVGRMLHQTVEEAGIVTPPPADQETLA